MKTYKDLLGQPESRFFAKTEFYNSLRNKIIGDKEYEDVKKFYKTMHMQNFSDLNDLYNTQDTILLCKIFENRAVEMMKKCPYDPRKCTSTSLFSSCFHRYLSKAIIALPTKPKHVELFKKTLIGSFSWINTRLAFDSMILFPKNEKNAFEDSLKPIYKVRSGKDNVLEDKRIVRKILKWTKTISMGLQ